MFFLPPAKTLFSQWFFMVWHCDSWARRGGTHRFSSWHLPSRLLKTLFFQWFFMVFVQVRSQLLAES